jgi:hypothetical protein
MLLLLLLALILPLLMLLPVSVAVLLLLLLAVPSMPCTAVPTMWCASCACAVNSWPATLLMPAAAAGRGSGSGTWQVPLRCLPQWCCCCLRLLDVLADVVAEDLQCQDAKRLLYLNTNLLQASTQQSAAKSQLALHNNDK